MSHNKFVTWQYVVSSWAQFIGWSQFVVHTTRFVWCVQRILNHHTYTRTHTQTHLMPKPLNYYTVTSVFEVNIANVLNRFSTYSFRWHIRFVLWFSLCRLFVVLMVERSCSAWLGSNHCDKLVQFNDISMYNQIGCVSIRLYTM